MSGPPVVVVLQADHVDPRHLAVDRIQVPDSPIRGRALKGTPLAGSPAVIMLLAAGSDYNLLVISRSREEIGAGLNAGLIRTMAGTGSVATAAGLMFAFTMCGFAFGCGRS